MRAITPIIICLFVFTSCKKEVPDLPPEYEYIKGEWVAYETTANTSDLHGGYIPHTKAVDSIDFRLLFYTDKYILRRENIDKVYKINDVYLENSYDTNVIRFVGPDLRYYYYINEDVLYSGGCIEMLFPEILEQNIEGGHTFYRRVQ